MWWWWVGAVTDDASRKSTLGYSICMVIPLSLSDLNVQKGFGNGISIEIFYHVNEWNSPLKKLTNTIINGTCIVVL